MGADSSPNAPLWQRVSGVAPARGRSVGADARDLLASQAPPHRQPRIGAIDAERPGLDAGGEVMAERGVGFPDLPDRRLERLRDVDARALRDGSGAPIAAAETDRSRELCGELLDLSLGCGRTVRVPARRGFVDDRAQLSK